jgi:hypothetical protein
MQRSLWNFDANVRSLFVKIGKWGCINQGNIDVSVSRGNRRHLLFRSSFRIQTLCHLTNEKTHVPIGKLVNILSSRKRTLLNVHSLQGTGGEEGVCQHGDGNAANDLKLKSAAPAGVLRLVHRQFLISYHKVDTKLTGKRKHEREELTIQIK